ncbi:MAG: ABC transporter ATP-binding protein [Erysipelothrix sp.]|nr:ABC transporter ATP-binding protein [Erysipelothrix sp.]
MSYRRGRNVEKPQNTKATFMRLLNYVFELRIYFVVAILLSFIANALQLLGPYFTGKTIDLLDVSAVQFSQILDLIYILIGVYVLSASLLYILNTLMIHVTQKIVVKMRKQLFDKFMDLPAKYFDNHQIGDMISRISYDIDTINTSLSSDIIQFFGSIVTIVGALIMMIIISPILLSVFVITLPLSFKTTEFLAKKTRPLFKVRSQKLGDLNGYVEETISGIKTIKAYSQEDTMKATFQAKNADASEAYYKADYYGSVMGPSIGLVNNISLALISFLGSVLYLFSKITIGNISSFILYSRRFAGPITEGANIIAELQSTLAAAERVFRVLDEPLESDAVDVIEAKSAIAGEVVFDNVTFGYSKDNPVLHNINMQIKPGSVVAIVGPTGAGKTTLVNLLMRFYHPDEGRILIDQQDIAKLPYKAVRQYYSMVLQDTWLFYGSILDNIKYGNEAATFEQVQEVVEKVHLKHFVENSKDGYETLISDDGVNLSKGQKQLMTIARAMLQDNPMIILDEATSNVDTMTEKRIQEAMLQLTKNKTSFIIAHRLSTIVNADLILVVKDGRIIEIGQHDQLLAKQGFYYRLFMAQFQ